MLQSLPDFLANRVLDGLLREHRISAAQLHLFAACATCIRVPPRTPLNDGGSWLAAIRQFRCVRAKHEIICWGERKPERKANLRRING